MGTGDTGKVFSGGKLKEVRAESYHPIVFCTILLMIYPRVKTQMTRTGVTVTRQSEKVTGQPAVNRESKMHRVSGTARPDRLARTTNGRRKLP